MKRILCFFPVVVLLSLSNALYGQVNPDCSKETLSQSGLNRCAAADLAAADQELNRVYQQIRQAYAQDPVFLEQLQRAQRAWIQFRDAEFAAKYPHAATAPRYYGSAFPSCASQYKAELTRERVKMLRRWLEGVREGEHCSGSMRVGSR